MRKSDLLKSLKYRLRFLPDKIYIRIYYRLRLRKKLNLDNPTTFNEKLQWLKRNFFYIAREYPYKNIQAKLIAEEFISDSNKTEITDYKFFYTRGTVHNQFKQ